MCNFKLVHYPHRWFIIVLQLLLLVSLVFHYKNTPCVVVGFEFIRLALVWVARVPVSRPRDEVSRVSP